jgi:dolichol-phosphate mannosyltransferase
MGDQNRAFILFIKWMGFRSVIIDITHSKRASGKSSYTLKKQLCLACEIIITQSNKPLIFSTKIGFIIAILAFLYAIFLILRFFISGISVAGWTSIIVSIWFIGGIILAQLGILGMYVGYVFDQTKSRPIFIVRNMIKKGISKFEF